MKQMNHKQIKYICLLKNQVQNKTKSKLQVGRVKIRLYMLLTRVSILHSTKSKLRK